MASGLRFEQIGGCYPLDSCAALLILFQEEETPHVIYDIGQFDPHGGPGDTDSSNEQTHLRFLIRKDMLDARSDDKLSGIRFLDMRQTQSKNYPKNRQSNRQNP